MGFFDWSAPIMHRHGDRWTSQDVTTIVRWISPLPARDARVLDLGGASGGLATRIADATGATVTVLDPTSLLLERLPVRAGVTGVKGVAEHMPFEDTSFDAIVCTDAFHHFRDQEAAAREMHRVARPGASILVLDPDLTRTGRPIAWMERLFGEPAAFLTPDGITALFERNGIRGTAEYTSAPSYRFLGTVPAEEG